MTDEYLSLMDSDEESAETTVIIKDEQKTGYESECSSRSEEDAACPANEVDAFTRFIERQRVEIMFELRRLRLGERPVTGQSNRERIETFLNNIQQDTRIPSTRPVVPSAHIADIDALANRRCVSAALNSPAFRQDLESAVRRSIGTRRTTISVQHIPQAPPLPRTLAPVTIEQQITRGSSPLATLVALTTREREGSQTLQSPGRHEPLNMERQERELHAWQTITQLQREIIVLEISDLVHRQLVTNALESDFRQHLEQRYLIRLEQEAPPQEEQQVVPIVVAPQVPIPIVANTRRSVSTMDSLSLRLDGMQHMLRLMYSMQMDMQRSLRHEVASSSADNSLTTMTSTNHPINAGHCTVCLTAIADTVLYRCGHLCVCYMCGINLREATSTTGMKCPICRAPVDDILRIYRSSRDGE